VLEETGRSAGFGMIPNSREGVRLLGRFEGRDEGGKTVRVDVRFSLDPSDLALPLPAPSAARYTPPTVMMRRLGGHQAVRRGQERAFSLPRF
jgi:hypothetical protein